MGSYFIKFVCALIIIDTISQQLLPTEYQQILSTVLNPLKYLTGWLIWALAAFMFYSVVIGLINPQWVPFKKENTPGRWHYIKLGIPLLLVLLFTAHVLHS